MSARFFKILSAVFLAHLLVMGIVWVGFSAPLPKLPARFIYQGAFPAEDTLSQPSDVGPNEKAFDQFILDHLGTSYSNHWIKLREPSKPLY